MTVLRHHVFCLAILCFGQAVHADDAKQSFFRDRIESSSVADILLKTDQHQLYGWICDHESYARKHVEIRFKDRAGDEHQPVRVPIRDDNTFTWNHRTAKARHIEVRVGDLVSKHRIAERPRDTSLIAVHYVVDRTAYRPGDKVKFAAFLRRETVEGEWQPVRNKTVACQVVSRNKQTTATTLELTSDSFGRITGEFHFTEADMLDTYDISIAETVGKAIVKLAEFRKAKVRLNIDAKRVDEQLLVEFQAFDFLENPVVGESVSYSLTVSEELKRTPSNPVLLKSKFAFAEANLPFGVFDPFAADWNDEDSDTRLLKDVGELMFRDPQIPSKRTLGIRTGKADISADGNAIVKLPIPAAWIEKECDVSIAGVLIDSNGREQRSTKMISFDSDSSSELLLVSDKSDFVVDEPIEVRVDSIDGGKAEAETVVTAFRLQAPPHWENTYGYGYGGYGYGGYGYGGGYGGYGYVPIDNAFWAKTQDGWNLLDSQFRSSSIGRELESVTVARDNVATLRLKKPGAYRLVAIANLKDGRELRNEIGCVVRAKKDQPGLLLELDKADMTSGENLRGELHCRFKNARVLLTVRDSTGLRLHRSVHVKDGYHRINQQLPTNLRYGCVVEAHYLESKAQLHSAAKFFRVDPQDRTIAVQITQEDQAKPGEEVTLDIDVDREEQVDLVVSVFDKALLGIAHNENTDVRDFFLADARVRRGNDTERLKRALNGVTLGAALQAVRDKLDSDEQFGNSLQVGRLKAGLLNMCNVVLQQAASNRSVGVTTDCLMLLLQESGVEIADTSFAYYGNMNVSPTNFSGARPLRDVSLFELVNHPTWSSRYRFVGNRLVFTVNNHRYGYRGGYGGAYGGGYGGGGGPGGFASGNSVFSAAPMAVSEFTSNAHDSGRSVRRDFSDSALWNSKVRTDKNGKATVKFTLPDSLTHWQVAVTAISPKMHVGSQTSSFRTVKPIMVWPMVPRVFTSGDRVRVFASVHNRTDKKQEIDASLVANQGTIHSAKTVSINVPANSNAPVYWEYQPTSPGQVELLMSATSSAGNDGSLKRIPVSDCVAEELVTASGFIKESATLEIPEHAKFEGAKLQLTLMPSLAEDLLDSLDYLVEYPHGCVEQTMSRFLPALTVKQTLDRIGMRDHALDERLPGVISAGVKRLLQLQSSDGGWGYPNDAMIAPTLNFFAATKRGKRWNSTKDTAQIIYAICDYVATQDVGEASGTIAYSVNDQPSVRVELGHGKPVKIDVPVEHLRHGRNEIRFQGKAPGAMYRAMFIQVERAEINRQEHGLRVQRKFFLIDSAGGDERELERGDTVPQGSYIRSVVRVQHELKERMNYLLVQNFKPATCEILPCSDKRFKQQSCPCALREDKTVGVFYHHENTPALVSDECILLAEIAGKYRVPPAKAELMYDTLNRGHSADFEFNVAPKADRNQLGSARVRAKKVSQLAERR